MLTITKKHLRAALRKLRGKPVVERFYRDQVRFKTRYPKYDIGVGSYGMPVVHDWSEGSSLTIGSYCSIANNVQILLGGQHRVDWVSTFPFPAYIEEASHIKDFGGTRGDVVIGSNVWLCTDATILSGVTVGHGAVVACSAVVTRDVLPYSIVAGNPATIVRWRFDEPTRRKLLDIAWWNWPEKEIRQVAGLLCSDDTTALINYASARKSRL